MVLNSYCLRWYLVVLGSAVDILDDRRHHTDHKREPNLQSDMCVDTCVDMRVGMRACTYQACATHRWKARRRDLFIGSNELLPCLYRCHWASRKAHEDDEN